jgi:predicted nucleic acid-binding protein
VLAPAIWEAEIANVVWMSIRAGVLPETGGPAKLHPARRLGIQTVAIRGLWNGALLRSLRSGIAICDTLFGELAECMGAPLVTFDQRLLKSWLAIACRPGEIATKTRD